MYRISSWCGASSRLSPESLASFGRRRGRDDAVAAAVVLPGDAPGGRGSGLGQGHGPSSPWIRLQGPAAVPGARFRGAERCLWHDERVIARPIGISRSVTLGIMEHSGWIRFRLFPEGPASFGRWRDRDDALAGAVVLPGDAPGGLGADLGPDTVLPTPRRVVRRHERVLVLCQDAERQGERHGHRRGCGGDPGEPGEGAAFGRGAASRGRWWRSGRHRDPSAAGGAVPALSLPALCRLRPSPPSRGC